MSANLAWRETIAKLLSNASCQVDSPYGETSEILGYTYRVDMHQPLLTAVGRKLNYGFCAAEAAHILSGQNKSKPLENHIKNYHEYTHDGIHIQWAYGPKFVEQAWYCAEVLAHDPNSRRAVMTLWRENPRWDDPPCTIMLQFLIRRGHLSTMVYMRSNDAWMGMPYDIFAFTMMTTYVMLLIKKHALDEQDKWRHFGVPLNVLTVFVGSMHLYDKHRQLAFLAIKGPFLKATPFQPQGYAAPDELIEDLNNMAAGAPPRSLPHADTIEPDTGAGEKVHTQ